MTKKNLSSIKSVMALLVAVGAFLGGIHPASATQPAKPAQPTQPTQLTLPLKSTNVTIQPIGFLVGTANAAIVFAVDEMIAVGPSLAFSSINATNTALSVTTWGFGVTADFFLNHPRFTDGIVLTTELGYANASAGGLSGSGVGLSGQFGYGWFWPGGFNMSLQGGLAVSTAKVANYSISAVSAIIGFGLGWAF